MAGKGAGGAHSCGPATDDRWALEPPEAALCDAEPPPAACSGWDERGGEEGRGARARRGEPLREGSRVGSACARFAALLVPAEAGAGVGWVARCRGGAGEGRAALGALTWMPMTRELGLSSFHLHWLPVLGRCGEGGPVRWLQGHWQLQQGVGGK